MTDDETTGTLPEAEADSNPAASESGFTEDSSSESAAKEETAADVEDVVDTENAVDTENVVDAEEVVDSENVVDAEDSKSIHGEDEEVVEPSLSRKSSKPDKRPGMAKGILEYDLSDMYPEVSTLVGKPRREWNYHDPEVIRAIWLDSKTNAITEWKIRYANMHKARHSKVEIPLNHTAQLRLELHKTKEEEKRAEFKKSEQMMGNGNGAPHFNTIQMATTTTVEMRYKFIRNNPPVPSYYINHYDKYKKPPFKTKISRPCKQDEP